MSGSRINADVEPSLTPASAALASVCAARLHGQGALAQLSLLLTGGAGVALVALYAVLVAAPSAASSALHSWSTTAMLGCLVAAALTGMVERYLAVRLVIDARIFDDMARGSVATLAALDQALTQLHLAPAAKAGRSLTQRTEGALRLVRWHTRAVGLQLLLLTAAAGMAASMATGQGAPP